RPRDSRQWRYNLEHPRDHNREVPLPYGRRAWLRFAEITGWSSPSNIGRRAVRCDIHEGAADANPGRTQQHTHRIDVQIIRYGVRGPVYRVLHAGEVLLEGCRCPLFEACRALLAKGITVGRLELWRSGMASWDLAVDVTVGAKLSVVETETEGP